MVRCGYQPSSSGDAAPTDSRDSATSNSRHATTCDPTTPACDPTAPGNSSTTQLMHCVELGRLHNLTCLLCRSWLHMLQALELVLAMHANGLLHTVSLNGLRSSGSPR